VVPAAPADLNQTHVFRAVRPTPDQPGVPALMPMTGSCSPEYLYAGLYLFSMAAVAKFRLRLVSKRTSLAIMNGLESLGDEACTVHGTPIFSSCCGAGRLSPLQVSALRWSTMMLLRRRYG
jgi:hypothetical protein